MDYYSILMNCIFAIGFTFFLPACCPDKAFESDSKAKLVEKGQKKKGYVPPKSVSPCSVVPPRNVPVSPAEPPEDTLAEVKSIASDNSAKKKKDDNLANDDGAKKKGRFTVTPVQE